MPESASFDIDERMLTLPEGGRPKSTGDATSLRILQEIARGLSERGYRITGLRSRNISDAKLRCMKSGTSAGVTLFADRRGQDLIHCELNVWSFHSTFDREEVRERKISTAAAFCHELRLIIDQQLRQIPGLDALKWDITDNQV